MPLRTIIIKATRSGTASTVIIRRGASGTGTGGGVTDHGALTGREDDDHTQYFNQTRGDARYPSITYAGANPNHPQSLTLTGVDTAGVNGTLVYCGLIYGKAAWSSDGSKIAGLANPLNTLVSSGAAGDIWLVQRGDIYAANKASTAATPAGLTGWTVGIGSGQPVIAASISAPSLPVGTHIGQFCQASGGLWRWNGSAWFEVTATASSISNAAVLAALPSTSPLPITSGGTGAANLDALQPKITSLNASAIRTDLKLDDATASLSLAGLTVASGSIATSQPLTLTQTWSTTATYTGLRVNVTDSGPSNAASLLMDLQVGGVSRFKTRKDGRVFGDADSSYAMSGGFFNFFSYGVNTLSMGSTTLSVGASGSYTGALSLQSAAGGITLITSDAPNILAQRNGTNAQTSRIYDTYTSGSDYHRLAIATARATATAMTGATITLTNIIPAGAVVVGITCKVTTAITGATSFDLGTAADVDRFGSAIAILVGTTSDNRNWTSGTVECFPANTSLILTANGGNFATGAVYVSVQYLSGQAD